MINDEDLRQLYQAQLRTLLEDGFCDNETHFRITKQSLQQINQRWQTLTSLDVMSLTRSLVDYSINKLTILNCGLDDRSIVFIEELLRANPRIHQVDLSDNRLITTKGLSRIELLLNELHPTDTLSEGCFPSLSTTMTFFKRAVFNIKVVGGPPPKPALILSYDSTYDDTTDQRQLLDQHENESAGMDLR